VFIFSLLYVFLPFHFPSKCLSVLTLCAHLSFILPTLWPSWPVFFLLYALLFFLFPSLFPSVLPFTFSKPFYSSFYFTIPLYRYSSFSLFYALLFFLLPSICPSILPFSLSMPFFLILFPSLYPSILPFSFSMPLFSSFFHSLCPSTHFYFSVPESFIFPFSKSFCSSYFLFYALLYFLFRSLCASTLNFSFSVPQSFIFPVSMSFYPYYSRHVCNTSTRLSYPQLAWATYCIQSVYQFPPACIWIRLIFNNDIHSSLSIPLSPVLSVWARAEDEEGTSINVQHTTNTGRDPNL
jgi:hypothetical protein